MKNIKTLLSLLLFTNLLAAQTGQLDSAGVTSEEFPLKKIISVAGVSSLYLSTIVDSYYTWWHDDKRPFSFTNSPWVDPGCDNGIDKLGHFYTSYFFYKFQKNLFRWGGFSEQSAKLLSGVMSFGLAVIIEVGDGYSRYGFDYKDLTFNAGGVLYGYLQDEIPYLKNINIKWSYIPVEGFDFPPRFSEHYTGHIYWITFNLAGLFNIDQPLLDYIQPAVGYSINQKSQAEYIFGIDLNLLPLFRSDIPVIGYIGDVLNLFHIPSPGIKYMEKEIPEYRIFLLH